MNLAGSASSVLADSDVGKGSPIGLLVVLLLIVAVYFLYRSMNRHLRKVPPEFDPPGERHAEAKRPPESNRPPEANLAADASRAPEANLAAGANRSPETDLPPVGGPASPDEQPPDQQPGRPDDGTR